MQNIKLQKLVLGVAVLLFILKLSAYFITKSNAILTDALESIANVVAGIFGLFSLTLASKPKDSDHPYGHGKIEFISASIEGAMILIAGLIIIGKSVYNIFYPHTVEHLDYGIALITIAGIINYLLGLFVEKKGKRTNSFTLIASGKHLQSDGWTTLGLLLGLSLLFIFKFNWIDSAVAVLFGLYIGYEGLKIIRKSVAGIMDEADTELLKSTIEILNKNREQDWIDIHNLRIIKYGATLHYDAHLTVPYYFSVKEGHNALERMEQLIHHQQTITDEWFVHIDACVPPAMCKICLKNDCKFRQATFEKKIEWNLENVLRNRKHSIDE